MKIAGLICLFIFTGIYAQTSDFKPDNRLFKIDIRPRYINNESALRIVVQIDNLTGKPVQFLEGFLLIIDIDESGNRIIRDEHRMTQIQGVNAPLPPEMSVSDGFTIKTEEISAHQEYEFRISKVKFVGDYRVYTYDARIGLKRID